MSVLESFRADLAAPRLAERLAAGLVGHDAVIEGPFGPKPMVYCDYVASGRALRQVEEFVLTKVLPFYANSHTRASHCGAYTTGLREEIRAEIGRIVGAGPEQSVIFAGSGSTAGLNRIAMLLDIPGVLAAGGRAVVLVGPYEHHSNLLPWRESGAEVIEIPESEAGGPDMAALDRVLAEVAGAALVVGAFGAASNVTGILTDVEAVTRRLKAAGALAVWDYGCAGPYTPMTMGHGTDAAKDAIVFSSHKFPGGPGGSGVMVLDPAVARRRTPTLPGGGTVAFVSPWGHVYSDDLADREEGGTPNVVGDIRAGLSLMIKAALTDQWLADRQEALRRRAEAVWAANPRIELLGRERSAAKLPIFSFRVRDGKDALVHHQLFTRMLSDIHGIQARGGCACAGSYAHRLLGLDEETSAAIVAALEAGIETEKPGWVRLNLSALMSDEKVDFVIEAVDSLAREASDRASAYAADTAHARFTARALTEV
ncbi:aminotransferase class V-fold PLP-dependent enzyme [Frigidibacter sp. MR17.14]|uniref:aminotransferase class V-fold PLP-dependent enzyme n=1 Tax=Frigidibacter sp. MR17.14 TaxID=3126509 RepID=UPI003012CE86